MNNQKKWEILGKLKVKSEKLKVEDVVQLLLKNRGIKTQKERKEFFNPTHPEKIPLNTLGVKESEIKKAIERLKKAKKNKEKVIVYGDYDADGICGTAILWETLYSLDLNVLPYIPERFSEGYGLNIDSIKRLKDENPNLGVIITVDHGVVAGKKVDIAGELGIDVIITDHHTLGKISPKAHSIVHTTKISGAAVAWILAREINKKLKVNSEKLKVGDGLELVAIGTIADQLPLIGPNRSFAKHGLETLNKTTRPGLLALFKEAGIKTGLAPRSVSEVGPYEVGFLIAPRINAMGRMEHAIESLRLLCTKDRGRAQTLAAHLNRTNLERQKVVEKVVLHAKGSVRRTQKRLIVLAHESYHEGVIGLAASRLVEEFYRPAIVISKKKDIAKASARSIPGFNIIEAIRKLEDLLLEGGGHPMAAGFSIQTEKIEEFSQRINKISTPLLTEDLLTKKLKIDVLVHFNQLNFDLHKEIKTFEPMGLGNPAAVFATFGVKVIEARVVGRDGGHLKLKLEADGCVFDAIGFGFGAFSQKLFPEKEVDIAYNLEENIWNNEKRLELKIKDMRIK